MPAPALVLVTTHIDDRAAAERIARELVEARLAACVKISGPVVSTYRWEGTLESAQEWTVAAVCPAGRRADLVAAVVAAHAYELPEVLVTPVLGGHQPYLDWVVAECSDPAAGWAADRAVD